MNIKIEILQKGDAKQLEPLFRKSITRAFKDDGIYDLYRSEILTECKKQLSYVRQFFETNGKDVFYLVAKIDGQIVGTIAYSTTNNNTLIADQVKDIDYAHTPEISSVYILPAFQGKGIGSVLLKSMLLELKNKGFTRFCLDGGYKKSQKFWKHKIGNPNITLKDFYGTSLDYMIWIRSLSDIDIT